jgi:hypothetical protein
MLVNNDKYIKYEIKNRHRYGFGVIYITISWLHILSGVYSKLFKNRNYGKYQDTVELIVRKNERMNK